MRNLIAASMVATLSACATGTEVGGAGDRQEAAAMTSAWREAYNSRDPARIIGLYDADAVLWGTRAKTIAADPAGIAKYFGGARSRPDARVTFGEQHLRVYGDVAFSSGYYNFSDVRDGKATERPSRFTMVFRNRGGQWYIVAHHSSEVP